MIYQVSMILLIFKFSYAFDNTSSIFDRINVINKHSFESRQSKLLSFNTFDDNIVVDLSFEIPFMSIPTKKTMSIAQESLANINIGALVLSGGLVVGVTLLAPFLLGLFNKQMTYPHWQKSESYRDSGTTSEQWKYMEFVEKMMGNIHTTSCLQRVLCKVVSESATNVKDGRASSTDKIVDGISTSPWIIDQLQGTFMYSALRNGLDRRNCNEIYTQCNIPEETIQSVISIFQSFLLRV